MSDRMFNGLILFGVIVNLLATLYAIYTSTKTTNIIPTLTAVSNVSSVTNSKSYKETYGSVVKYTFKLNVTPTAFPGSTIFTITPDAAFKWSQTNSMYKIRVDGNLTTLPDQAYTSSVYSQTTNQVVVSFTNNDTSVHTVYLEIIQ